MSPTTDHETQRNFIGTHEVTYRVNGAGPRIVLIHGLGQDHHMWVEIQGALPDFTTFAYDIRGHGLSALGEAEGTLAQLGQDLIEFLQEVGPSVCIGFSLGGAIALWAASERPELVGGIIAVATSSVVGRAAAESLEQRITEFETGSNQDIHAIMLADTESQLALGNADASRITDERMLAIGDRRGYINGAKAVCSMRTDSVNLRLAKITAPVLIISGENDSWCPRRAADIMLEQLPTAAFVELPGVGHLVTDDDSGSLTRVVRHWLEQREHG